MLLQKKFYLILMALVLVQACGQAPESAQYASQTLHKETSPSAPPMSSENTEEMVDLGANLNLDQEGRKFLRSSEVQFQVEDTRKATRQIEDICAHYGGFITYTNLRSEVTRSQKAKISQDSSQVKEYYTVQNEMTLRIPQQNLDSVIRAFNPLVSFLHYRILKAEDVQLRLLAEEMQKKRDATLDQRLDQAIQNSEEAPLDEVRDTETFRHQQDVRSDQATLERMKLEDQIAYSELKVYLYQPEVFRNYQVAHVNPISVPFGQKIALAFQRSLVFLQQFFLILIELWYLLLGAGIAFYTYQRYAQRQARA